jgi:hypothetical protein
VRQRSQSGADRVRASELGTKLLAETRTSHSAYMPSCKALGGHHAQPASPPAPPSYHYHRLPLSCAQPSSPPTHSFTTKISAVRAPTPLHIAQPVLAPTHTHHYVLLRIQLERVLVLPALADVNEHRLCPPPVTTRSALALCAVRRGRRARAGRGSARSRSSSAASERGARPPWDARKEWEERREEREFSHRGGGEEC